MFTSPHGGNKKLKETPQRNRSNLPHSCNGKQFNKISDLFTSELTEDITKNMVSMSVKGVYKKIAEIDRSWIDFNRGPECAFEPSNDRLAEQLYREYHMGIKKIIKEIYSQNRKGLCLLVDLHGTRRMKVNGSRVDIFFGTDGGNTICGLLELNPDVLWDNNGLIKLIQDKDYHTYPQVKNQKEFKYLDGGFTIKKSGACNRKRRVEALQCEVSLRFRKDSHRREQFARDMAECILKFISQYLA
ncbi:MAG: hypothetical protein WA941_15285 [Nitrososphaeraceae archaeon]